MKEIERKGQGGGSWRRGERSGRGTREGERKRERSAGGIPRESLWVGRRWTRLSSSPYWRTLDKPFRSAEASPILRPGWRLRAS